MRNCTLDQDPIAKMALISRRFSVFNEIPSGNNDLVHGRRPVYIIDRANIGWSGGTPSGGGSGGPSPEKVSSFGAI